MSEADVIQGAQAIAVAHHMTPEETETYVGRCLVNYNRGYRDAERLSKKKERELEILQAKIIKEFDRSIAECKSNIIKRMKELG